MGAVPAAAAARLSPAVPPRGQHFQQGYHQQSLPEGSSFSNSHNSSPSITQQDNFLKERQ
ncbi:TPA: hypothetical protein ACH3X1_005814 [Trebouxia sp. C0004]